MSEGNNRVGRGQRGGRGRGRGRVNIGLEHCRLE
jgi:hypothetical protein